MFFLHNSSNPSKNYFQHAVTKNEVLTAVPSKKYLNSVKISNILRNVSESRDHAKPLLTINVPKHLLSQNKTIKPP